MTHRDGLPGFSARSVQRGDAGPREARTTLSAPLAKSLGKPPLRSSMRSAGGRRKVLTMHRIDCDSPPARRAAWTIPMGHYHRSLVLAHHCAGSAPWQVLMRHLNSPAKHSEFDGDKKPPGKRIHGRNRGIGGRGRRRAPFRRRRAEAIPSMRRARGHVAVAVGVSEPP